MRLPFFNPLKCSLFVFVLLCAVGNTLIFQAPLLKYAATHLTAGTIKGALTLITVLVIPAGLLMTVLLLASLGSVRLVKPLSLILVLGNAIALYFMNSYNVVLDRSMMGNVFRTDVREAGELLNIQLIWYLFAAGLVPTILLLKLNIQPTTLVRKVATLSAVLLTLFAWLYANSSSWLWIDKHAQQIGGTMLPWSYVVNTARHFDQVASANRPQVLLPAAYFSAPLQPDQKRVVVLVIGEAARAQNFSLYGYPRSTNPFTAPAAMAVMLDARACSTYTTRSLTCMLSHQGEATSSAARFEVLPSYLKRHGVDVAWRTNNWGEPPMQVSTYERPADIQKACEATGCMDVGFDGVLLNGLKERIRDSTNPNVLIMLHLNGSHGPAYNSKYPPKFEHFMPVCKSVDLQTCTRQTLVNAYDNTLRYTDHLLSKLIGTLEELDDVSSTLIYQSDHGESLGEYGLYLHGAPASIAPDTQTKIPFLVWMSLRFQSEKGLTPEGITRSAEQAHDYVFHSVMGAFGLRSDIYKFERDVFHKHHGTP